MGGLFDNVIIGFIVFSVVILAGALIIGDLDDSYGDIINMTNATDDFSDTYNTIDEVYDLTKDVRDQTIDADIDEDSSDAGSISGLTRGAYSAVRLVPRTFRLFNSIINGIAGTLGLSCDNDIGSSRVCVFIDFALIAFMTTIIFGVVYLIFRFRPR